MYQLPVENFDFVPKFEAAYPEIRAEIEAVLNTAEKKGFIDAPYANWKSDGEGRWEMLAINCYGNEIEENKERFPVTNRLLREVKGLHTAGFVNLGSHSHLKAHAGREWKNIQPKEMTYLVKEIKGQDFSNSQKIPVYRAHLTLINKRPDLTRLRVWETEPHLITRDIVAAGVSGTYDAKYVDLTWHEGKMIAFDDTYLHEAKNESDFERVILLFDFDKREYGYPARTL
jgi:hypothetical protein